jgi:hypothetical protein
MSCSPAVRIAGLLDQQVRQSFSTLRGENARSRSQTVPVDILTGAHPPSHIAKNQRPTATAIAITTAAT